MRYLLTGDVFSAEEAYRLGLVQEIVPKKNLLESAIQLAKKIAEQAPLSIKATLENSRKYVMEGEGEATKNLISITTGLLKSQDGKEGIQSFLEKRKANFIGN
jgi:enoyl-CoA hydratase/carnithine racemase